MNYTVLIPHAKLKNCYADKHHSWKGDRVGYKGLHAWVRSWLPKVTGRTGDSCEFCGRFYDLPASIHLANISGDYKRDLEDWLWLCRGCHHKYDAGLI